MQKNDLKRLIYSALFLAIGMVLPLLTFQLKEIGDSLLPMHLPVMLCGLICGHKYGLVVGASLPFLRSLIFGMPPLYPNAIWMGIELATYGFVIGFMYSRIVGKKRGRVIISLVVAMLLGRVMWGISKALLLGIGGKLFTINAFIIGGFVDAIPGIIIQLLLIPAIMTVLEKSQIKTQGRAKI